MWGLEVIGKIAEALEVEPAELLKVATEEGGRKPSFAQSEALAHQGSFVAVMGLLMRAYQA